MLSWLDLKLPPGGYLPGLVAWYGLELGPGEEGGVGLYGVLVEVGIGWDSGLGVEGEVVAVLEVVLKEGFLAWVYDGVDEIEIEGELWVVGEESCDIGLVEAGGTWKIAIIGTCTDSYLNKFEYIWGEFSLKREDVAGRRAEPLVEGEGGVASGDILVDACPLVSGAGLQRHWSICFNSCISFFGVGAIDKIDIEVPKSIVKINALNANGKHEGVAGVVGDEVQGAGVVLVVDILIREDDVFVDGVDGGVGEDYHEEDEDDNWDYAADEGAVGLLLFVAEEGGVGEEI